MYCTYKPRTQGNERARIPRTLYCFLVNGPGKEVPCPSALERAREIKKTHGEQKTLSVHEACYSMVQIMTLKATTRGTFGVDVVSIIYQIIVPYS